MSRVRLSPQVRRDLKEIDEYISRDNPDAAARVISNIREKCEVLSQQPGIGRNRSDLLPNLRSFPIGNYVIFYFPTGEGIEVIRVLHGARDIEQLFDED
jgi:toxin ParE1/3/4